MASYTAPRKNPRIGFHYFPDDLHYRENDLEIWLPQLQTLGATWLTLSAPAHRAIPEGFIRGLTNAGIEPVLHFHLPLDPVSAVPDMRLLFDTYARWGVRYAVIFDRPNLQSAWQPSSWAQKDLVERFLDRYLPLAEACLAAGLTPVFPPLEPGGDYWDTAFLRGALQGMQRRGHHALLERLVLSAYAWTGDHRLDWGAGGPERWPQARPYDTPIDSEDQRGFRIFEWYLTLARTVLHKDCEIILVGAGCRPGDSGEVSVAADLASHAQRNLALVKMLVDGGEVLDPDHDETLEPVPPQVLACCFWLLSANPDAPEEIESWFRPDGTTLPVVGSIWQWMAGKGPVERDLHHFIKDICSQVHLPEESAEKPYPAGNTPVEEMLAEAPEMSCSPVEEETPSGTASKGLPAQADAPASSKPIAHYLLLPHYEWGVSDWHLEVIRPYVRKYRPTVGYSMGEASLSERVTVIGGPGAFAEEKIATLRTAGCLVEEIGGDGTDIASQLATL